MQNSIQRIRRVKFQFGLLHKNIHGLNEKGDFIVSDCINEAE